MGDPHENTTVCSTNHGNPLENPMGDVGLPCETDGRSMGVPWARLGVAWESHGNPMGDLCENHKPMAGPWEPYDSPMPPLYSYGGRMETNENVTYRPMETVWKVHWSYMSHSYEFREPLLTHGRPMNGQVPKCWFICVLAKKVVKASTSGDILW